MDESENDGDQRLLESIVHSMASQALQLAPGDRFAFILRQVYQISLAYGEKHGLHPDPEERDLKLLNWAHALVDALHSGEDAPSDLA